MYNAPSRRGAAPEDADEDEEELLDWDQPGERDTVLWLIDAGRTMQENMMPSEGTQGKPVTLFHRAMQAAYQFQRKKLIESPKDHCGVLLFNTKHTKVDNVGKNVAYPHSVLVQPLAQVAVPPVSELKDDLQDSLDNGPSYFAEKYPPNEKQTRIHHALGNAEAMMFAAGKTGTKRIFFVTNQDNPMGDKKGRSEQHRLAFEKVRSMMRRGIEFEPFLISSEDHPFETSHFYSDVFCAYTDEDEEAVIPSTEDDEQKYTQQPWNATTKFQDLEGEVGARENPMRVIFSVPLTIVPEVGGGLTMGVKGYCSIRKATRGDPVKVKAKEREDEDDPVIYQEITTRTELQAADTGRILDRNKDVEMAFSFGSSNTLRSKVHFSAAEIRKLRASGQSPSIRILGFKPSIYLKFYENIKHAYFIYPSDTEWANSRRAFAALLDSMTRKDTIALSVFCPRSNVAPCFAYILPQPEIVGDEGQLEPPGMYVVPLPFADDIRDVPERHRGPPKFPASAKLIEAAGHIVRSYTRNAPYNPDFFPNPALQQHYNVLMASAFEEDVPEELQDKTIPNYEMIHKRCGPLVSAFTKIVEEDPRLVLQMKVASETSDKKRPQSFTSEDEPNLKKRYRDAALGTLVVDKLRAACEYYRLPRHGKKAELIARLEDFLDHEDAKKSR